jgi:hypothetical protein
MSIDLCEFYLAYASAFVACPAISSVCQPAGFAIYLIEEIRAGNDGDVFLLLTLLA